MPSLARAAVLTAAVLLTLSGCNRYTYYAPLSENDYTSGDAASDQPPETWSYTDVKDETGSDAYSVAPTAEGAYDHITLHLDVSNPNHTAISPHVVISNPHWSFDVVCEIDDPRRVFYLGLPAMTVEVPCHYGMSPDDADEATVTVTD